MDVSVIIPTYNRRSSLERLLQSLADQDYPKDRYEVIVVDDGSDDGTGSLFESSTWPVTMRYLRQCNSGPAVARNHGAREAKGNMLVFLDDDIVATPDLLREHLKTHSEHGEPVIVVGFSKAVVSANSSALRSALSLNTIGDGGLSQYADSGGFLPGTFCLSGNMSVAPATFRRLGAFNETIAPPEAGWSRWEDVEFGWRAEQAGVRTVYNPKALGYHHDYSAASLGASCTRWQRVASMAPYLFAKHPELEGQIPMFRDKGYIALGVDPPGLVVRKVLRAAVSWGPALWALERLTRVVEVCCPRPAVLRPLYRWVIGGYIFRGYRQGLRDRAASERRKELPC